MPKIKIDETGCRACSLCVDICPTKVLENDSAGKARVKTEEDCIGCTSCAYLCPSRCIVVSEIVEQRPYHRIEQNSGIIERFLQKQVAARALTEADIAEAKTDCSVRLAALTEAVSATMGRGQKTAGRKAGVLMAEHLPEMYEATSLDEALRHVQARFRHCFDFAPEVQDGGNGVQLRFSHCALADVVSKQGEKVGGALLCVLFHEYLAGLVGAFNDKKYAVEVVAAGAQCALQLQAQ